MEVPPCSLGISLPTFLSSGTELEDTPSSSIETGEVQGNIQLKTDLQVFQIPHIRKRTFSFMSAAAYISDLRVFLDCVWANGL